MKIFFKLLALSTIIISIYLNSNEILVISKVDEILEDIIQFSKENNQDKISSEIINNTILIGQPEKKVNIKQSYISMKQIGFFDKKFIVFESQKNQFEENINYEIIGAKTNKREISIIVLLNEEDKKYNIDNLSYFVDGYWYEKNKLSFDGITGYNLSYTNNNLPWLIYEAKKYNDISFCLNYKCTSYGLYNIKKDIIYSNYFYETKKNLNPGNIFVFDNNDSLNKEIELIVNYVKKQGYEIKKIQNLLNRY